MRNLVPLRCGAEPAPRRLLVSWRPVGTRPLLRR